MQVCEAGASAFTADFAARLHVWERYLDGSVMVYLKKQCGHIQQDVAANRVYQAFERLQIAWYTVNARRTAGGSPQFDEAALSELNAAEEEWLEARAAVSLSAISR